MDTEVFLICPECKAEFSINVNRYVNTVKNPEVKYELLNGTLGIHTCSCGFKGITSIPMIYHDPNRNLCVYVCDNDRDTLIDEFHELLDNQKSIIEIDDYNSILKSPFQIVVRFGYLAKIVTALEQNIFCYRMTPGISEVEKVPNTFFLKIANFYSLSKKHFEAFVIAHIPYEFGYREPSLLRELGAYAFSAGLLDQAENFVLASDRRNDELSHVWQQIVVPDGVVTKIPEEATLKCLEKSVRPKYQSLRPECNLDDQHLAQLCGILIVLFEKSNKQFGRPFELELYQEFIEHRTEELIKNQKSSLDREKIIDLIERTKLIVNKKLKSSMWPKTNFLNQ